MITNMATRVHRAVLVYRPFVTDIIGLRKMSSLQNKGLGGENTDILFILCSFMFEERKGMMKRSSMTMGSFSFTAN